MPGLADELRALANKKRTRKNFEVIQNQVAELKEHAESSESVTEAFNSARETLQELLEALDNAGDDNPLLSESVELREAVENLLVDHIPEEGDDVGSLVVELDEACESYEEVMDDREYGADAREEAWGELCNALDNVATAISPVPQQVVHGVSSNSSS